MNLGHLDFDIVSDLALRISCFSYRDTLHASCFTKLPFDNCRESSTNRPIFMQNKPNFQDTQMNVSANMTKDYEKISNPTLGENKPNSNPIQSQTNPIKCKKTGSKPKQTQNKANFQRRPNQCEILYRKPVMEIILKTAKFAIIGILQKNREFDSIRSTDATEGNSPLGGLEGPISERGKGVVSANFGRKFFVGVSGVLWRSPL